MPASDTSPPFRFELRTASPEAIASRNRAEERSGVRRYLPYERAMEELAGLEQLSPSRAESLLGHPDERVGYDVARQASRMPAATGRALVPSHLPLDAAQQALDAGELWTPYLDAIFTHRLPSLQPQHLTSVSERSPRERPIAGLARQISSWLSSRDTPDSHVCRLLDFEAPVLRTFVATEREASPATSGAIRDWILRELEAYLSATERNEFPRVHGVSLRRRGPLGDAQALSRLLSGDGLLEEHRHELCSNLVRAGERIARLDADRSTRDVARTLFSDVFAELSRAGHLTGDHARTILSLPDSSLDRSDVVVHALESMAPSEVVDLLETRPQDVSEHLDIEDGGRLVDYLLAHEDVLPPLESLLSDLPLPDSVCSRLLSAGLKRTGWRAALVDLALTAQKISPARLIASEHPDPRIRGRAIAHIESLEYPTKREKRVEQRSSVLQVRNVLRDDGSSPSDHRALLEEVIASDKGAPSTDFVWYLLPELNASTVSPEVQLFAYRLLARHVSAVSIRERILKASLARTDREVVGALVRSHSPDIMETLLVTEARHQLAPNETSALLVRLASKAPDSALALIEGSLDGSHDAALLSHVNEDVIARLLAAGQAPVRERVIAQLDRLQQRVKQPRRAPGSSEVPRQESARTVLR